MQPLKFLSEMLEILDEDLVQTQITDRKYGGAMNFQQDKKRSSSELGRGNFSKVEPDSDPHMVTKRSIKPMGPSHNLKADGFNQYVRMLSANDVMDNIHFPKVYKANTSTDKNNDHRNTFTVERLESLTSISSEEFQGLVERCFNRPVSDIDVMAERISESCESEYERKMYIKMETLFEACEIMQRLSQESDFGLDLHSDNLMVRRTPMGLQIVISDPFGYIKRNALHKYS